MKIALCFSGQCKSFLKSYQLYCDNIINNPNYEVDIFIHTWTPTDKLNSDNIYKTNYTDVPNNILEQLTNMYKPKGIIVEEQKIFKNKTIDYMPVLKKYVSHAIPIGGPGKLHTSYSMFYSIMKANELKQLYSLKNDIQYDVTIRARFDICPTVKINFENYDLNTFNAHNAVNDESQICDWFNFANDDIMNIFSSSFNYINHYRNDKEQLYPNEKIIYTLLNNFNIKIIKNNLQLVWQ
jgi:hypothetical protein